jgi:glycosyltransferase involved in cell wall biosynthesis
MKIILAVTNDICTDQRVNRVAASLLKLNLEVVVVGRKHSRSLDLPPLSFIAKRFNLFFSRGFLFYAEYNFRLFWFLMFNKADLLVANDLDTLPGVFLAARLKKRKLVYDSHEYFTEVPELIGRNRVKKIWERIEAMILPKIILATTVSGSIAMVYREKYGIEMEVILNLPYRIEKMLATADNLKNNGEMIILYQGSLNKGRGLELAIRAMQHVDHAKLVLIGAGDLDDELRNLTADLLLHDRVVFMGRMLPQELIQYTRQADLGISLEENLGMNYRFALPNKLFDYIQARVPVLVSDLPEMAAVVRHYQIGMVCSTTVPEELASRITAILSDKAGLAVWKANLEHAARELCWENEEHKLLELYRKALYG